MIVPSVRVATFADLTTGTDITDQLVTWDGRVPINNEGTGGLIVPFGETLTPSPIDNVVQFLFDGTVAHAFVGEARQPVELDEAEEAGMVTEYSGDGLASVLDRYIYEPPLGFGRSPWSTRRTFSAFSPEYVDHLASPWDDAIQIAVVGDESARYTGLPNGHPHFQGIWIGPPGTDDLEAPAGYWWWRDDIVLEDDTVVIFFTAGDNRYDFYVDGMRVAEVDEEREARSGFAETHVSILFLSAGTHPVGAKVTNLNPDLSVHGYGEGATVEGNPTAFTAVAYEVDGRGALGAILWETSTDARVLAFPDDPPGMTIPEICQVVVDENEADGRLPVVTVVTEGTFTELESVTVDITTDTLLKSLRDDWADVHVEWFVPPTDLELRLWPPGERGGASGVVFGPDIDPVAGNLLHLEDAILDVGIDAVMVTWENGPPFRQPSSGDGTRAAVVGTRARNLRDAQVAAAWVLSQPAQPQQIGCQIAPAGTGDIPGVDFDNGDTIDVGDHEDQRLLDWAFDASETRSGEPIFGITVNYRLPTRNGRLDKRIAAIISGDLGGVAPAAPTFDPPPFGSKINSTEVTFHPINPVPVVGPCDKEKRPVASGNMYAVAVTAETAGSTDTEFEFWVNDVDVLNGAGVLPSGELFALIPTDGVGSGLGVGPTIYALGNVTRMRPNISTVGTGVAGLVFEPRFL